jgi:hypothetical protein
LIIVARFTGIGPSCPFDLDFLEDSCDAVALFD